MHQFPPKKSRTNTLSSIAGWAGATVDPSWFVKEQTSTPSVTVDDNSRLVALQLGNCYGLLFLAAVAVLYTTTELKVVRNYLIALWIADIGHIAVCYFGLGFERFVDVASWNSSKQFSIRSLPLQEQRYPVSSICNKDFTGCKLCDRPWPSCGSLLIALALGYLPGFLGADSGCCSDLGERRRYSK